MTKAQPRKAEKVPNKKDYEKSVMQYCKAKGITIKNLGHK